MQAGLPVDCIVSNPDFQETSEQLMAKYESLHDRASLPLRALLAKQLAARDVWFLQSASDNNVKILLARLG